MKIVILEDSYVELNNLRNELNNWSIKSNSDIFINTYDSGEHFFAQNNISYDNIDLFILDISMKKMSGIDVAKKLRSYNYLGEIIFLTAFKEFVFDGYDVHAFNYLIKPVNKTILHRCLNEIEQKIKSNCHIYRTTNHETISIPYKDIICCSVNRHYVDIMTSREVFNQHIDLSDLLKILPYEFVQVHRSYIVNMSHVFSISHNKIYLSNNTIVDIGRTYSANFKKLFLNYSTRFNREED
ncbi:DNA-binding response regulator [Pseudobutyrivibrio ruminis]|uniref:Stage 0 sporulation protein A homolog n=1 Tax=Pseudobutyrivibrio ruminis TaxID=46206 RepID=A0A2G3EA74_9FIRM|nr:LytTR family DNA-binding domain-containing protein [Pseudobutyrivibrio ruminis]PHU40206.1 DNA-binding response regulator [Pseudobutyrivibrio ruminis]